MHPFAQDIHCSIEQSTSHCFSLLSHGNIAIHLISGLKLSRSRFQIKCLHGTKFLNPDLNLDCDSDSFTPCKWGTYFNQIIFFIKQTNHNALAQILISTLYLARLHVQAVLNFNDFSLIFYSYLNNHIPVKPVNFIILLSFYLRTHLTLIIHQWEIEIYKYIHIIHLYNDH